MMSQTNPTLRKLLMDVYAEMNDVIREQDRTRAEDFCFHMTDWQKDLHALAKLHENPGGHSSAEAERIVQSFLYHATAHIVEAAKLYDIFLNPFEKEMSPEHDTSSKSK